MIKHGVRLKGLVSQMAIADRIVSDVFRSYSIPCAITSANDSKHSDISLHYGKEGKYTDGLCRALDYRTHYEWINGQEKELADAVQKVLGPEFDVVLEAVGTPNEHMHVEYDPD